MIRIELMDDDSEETTGETAKEDDFIGAAELHFDNAPCVGRQPLSCRPKSNTPRC
jgi:hypothetical protein